MEIRLRCLASYVFFLSLPVVAPIVRYVRYTLLCLFGLPDPVVFLCFDFLFSCKSESVHDQLHIGQDHLKSS